MSSWLIHPDEIGVKRKTPSSETDPEADSEPWAKIETYNSWAEAGLRFSGDEKDKLGSGSTADVYRVYAINSGREYVVKVYKQDEKGVAKRAFYREFAVNEYMKRFHANLCSGVALCSTKTYRLKSSETSFNYVIELPASNSVDIEVFVANWGRRMQVATAALDPKTDQSAKFLRETRSFVLRVALDFVSDLLRLHAAGISHGDIKPENLMLLSGGRIPNQSVFIDFGGACLGGVATRQKQEMSQIVEEDVQDIFNCVASSATPLYIDPEYVDERQDDTETERFQNSKMRDIFAAGVVLFSLLAERPLSDVAPTIGQLSLADAIEWKPDASKIGQASPALRDFQSRVEDDDVVSFLNRSYNVASDIVAGLTAERRERMRLATAQDKLRDLLENY